MPQRPLTEKEIAAFSKSAAARNPMVKRLIAEVTAGRPKQDDRKTDKPQRREVKYPPTAGFVPHWKLQLCAIHLREGWRNARHVYVEVERLYYLPPEMKH